MILGKNVTNILKVIDEYTKNNNHYGDRIFMFLSEETKILKYRRFAFLMM